jgi:hypothetical protein
MEKTLGAHLQNWFIRNKIMSVLDPVFVDAVDGTIENALRDQESRLIRASANCDNLASSTLSTASTATSASGL